MKQGWEIKKLGEITEQINGLWVGKNPPFITIAVIRNTNFTKDCNLDTNNIAYIQVEQKQYSTRKLKCGDIIIEKSGGSDKQPVGRPILFNIEDGEYSFSNFTSVLRVVDNTLISPKFLHKFLVYAYNQGYTLNMQSKTTGIRNLNFKLYKNMNVPVPERAEQERIVGELDCLSGIIAAKRAQLRELDTLAQSIFYTMFGDPYSSIYKSETLSNLSKFKLSYGSCASAVKYNNEVRYIRITDIGEDGSLSDNIVSPNVVDDKYILQDGDLLFARSGATVGKTYLYDSKIGKSIYAGYLIRFIANKDIILPKYLYYYTKTGYYKDFIKNNIQAVAQPNINAQQYSKLKIVVPPIALQNEFVEKIEHIEEQKQLIKASIAETEDLFNSRMSCYFD